MARPGQSPQPPRGSRFDRLGASQRVAYGTAFRSIGEILAKPASLLFYVVMARELGQGSFGVFNFAISLGTLLMTFAGLGLQELIAREISRDRAQVHVLVWNALVLRGSLTVVLLAGMLGLTFVGDYSAESRLAILIVGVGVGLENLTSVPSAVFQAFERQHHTATSLLVNRFVTAALGIGLLLSGGGLVAVSAVTTFGSALGLITAYLLMQRRVVRTSPTIDRGSWAALLRQGAPIGVLNVLGEAALRSSVALFGLLATSQAQVGEYGAAFRLVEATLFISWSYSNAVMPWFSRHQADARATAGLARGFELSLKGVISITLPLALVFALFAKPVIDTLYGADYSGAVAPLRILAAMTVLWGINGVISAVLVGRGRPHAYVRPAAVAITVTAVLAVILMPRHGATGAALTTVPAAAILAVGTISTTVRMIGTVRPLRILATPLLAGGALAGTSLLLANLAWPAAAALALGAYGLVFAAAERVWCPEDYAYYARIVRIGRKRASD